ncbi:MAG TPA: ABC transporter ATP-binding protein [Acidimicrobiales bacterium]|nr:ABC transporter ATP-binding protein [Acidimicrobiales bacterium]
MGQRREQDAAGLAAALLVDESLQASPEPSCEPDRIGDAALALSVRNVDFSYGPVQVLFDVSIDVPRGQVLALLGTNGAGKSTLLRVVSGLGRATRGRVYLNGQDITRFDTMSRVRAGIVQVSGGKAAFPTLSVYENLLVGAHTFIWDTERVGVKFDEVLALFPALEPRLHSLAGTLSGGERQMLAIGKALMLEPEVLIIDELSLGLAPVIVQDLLRIVEGLKARGMTIILVEQSVNIALSIAERAIFMEKGRVRFEGASADLIGRDDLVRAVFLGTRAKRR